MTCEGLRRIAEQSNDGACEAFRMISKLDMLAEEIEERDREIRDTQHKRHELMSLYISLFYKEET